MALTVTVGSASADSYVTYAEYIAYVTTNIDASYSVDEATAEPFIRRAAQYIDRRHGEQFWGDRQYQDQAREWPRLTDQLVQGWPIDPDTVPQAIKDAQCELAHQLQTGAVDPFASVAASVKRERIGPIETEYQGGLARPRLTAITDALGPFLKIGTGQVQLVRG